MLETFNETSVVAPAEAVVAAPQAARALPVPRVEGAKAAPAVADKAAAKTAQSAKAALPNAAPAEASPAVAAPAKATTPKTAKPRGKRPSKAKARPWMLVRDFLKKHPGPQSLEVLWAEADTQHWPMGSRQSLLVTLRKRRDTFTLLPDGSYVLVGSPEAKSAAGTPPPAKKAGAPRAAKGARKSRPGTDDSGRQIWEVAAEWLKANPGAHHVDELARLSLELGWPTRGQSRRNGLIIAMGKRAGVFAKLGHLYYALVGDASATLPAQTAAPKGKPGRKPKAAPVEAIALKATRQKATPVEAGPSKVWEYAQRWFTANPGPHHIDEVVRVSEAQAWPTTGHRKNGLIIALGKHSKVFRKIGGGYYALIGDKTAAHFRPPTTTKRRKGGRAAGTPAQTDDFPQPEALPDELTASTRDPRWVAERIEEWMHIHPGAAHVDDIIVWAESQNWPIRSRPAKAVRKALEACSGERFLEVGNGRWALKELASAPGQVVRRRGDAVTPVEPYVLSKPISEA